ncbi:MAG: flavodoxin family protein [Eggerthellaceae bacterium]
MQDFDCTDDASRPLTAIDPDWRFVMKILAINGSHRPGRGTATLAEAALEEARAQGMETELIELTQCSIEFCSGCNRCLGSKTCSIDDDITEIAEKLRQADGIILASPNYCANVSARMKNFMDRTRFMHMVENQLKGKIGGIIATTGLSNCGGEEAVAAMQRWFQIQEVLIVQPRPEGEVLGNFCLGTMYRAYEDGKVRWQRISDDQIALKFARQLGHDMAELIKKLQ